MHHKFDLICLGSGPAALTVATTCAKEKLKVAVVESRELGGTCALRGCNPKKVFTNAASLVDQFQRARGRLTRGSESHLEWSDLVAFQREFTEPVPELTEEKLRKLGIETFKGTAQFESENVIRLGDMLLEAENVFIGVGARPVPLKIPGEDLIVTSDDFMEINPLPADVVFLGGGFISFEFGSVAALAGSSVTIVDRNELPLKSFDPDLVQLLEKTCRAAGIEILTETEITSIQLVEGRKKLTLRTSSGTVTRMTDMIVHGGGRVANVGGMNLEAGGVDHGTRGIVVNEFLQSKSNPAVYAAGDCADSGVPMLTPTANESARVAAKNIISDHASRKISPAKAQGTDQPKNKVVFGCVAQVVFSIPPLAAAGLSEAEARHKGYDVDIRFQDLSTKGEVRKLCAPAAGCKIIVDRETEQILGAHLLGPHAEEVINLFALAIQVRMTATDLKAMLFSYPTMTAEFLRIL
ncbi:dihydrolipoyl dehydrogenase family protein [Schlesneria sp. T3-172]|uniref:dihydrolipoyl dehydrogenase family protein n=1 Tax=Schlesneria sphaerica TaxID=3373610 RepID=UPI0037CC66CD